MSDNIEGFRLATIERVTDGPEQRYHVTFEYLTVADDLPDAPESLENASITVQLAGTGLATMTVQDIEAAALMRVKALVVKLSKSLAN